MGIKERQERDRQAVRRAILDAARDLFVKEGFDRVSMRRIAELVEYSPAAIYGYFPSKDDIFFALAEEGFRLLHAQHDFAGLEALPPLARVRELFWRFYLFSRDYPQYFALMFVDRSVPRITREYEAFTFAQEMKRTFTAHLKAAIDAGVLPPVEPDRVGRVVSTALVGAGVMRLSDRLVGDAADEVARDLLDVLLAGFGSTAVNTIGAVTAPPHVNSTVTAPSDVDSAATAPPHVNSAATPGAPFMSRVVIRSSLGALLVASLVTSACTSADGKAATAGQGSQPVSVAVAAVPAAEEPITRFIRVTGSLTAEEQAEVAAEVAGRVVAAPVERGTAVANGAELIRISATEADAQAKEAEANAAQIEARLGIASGRAFDVSVVPEVQTAKAALDLATNEFNRIKSLLDQRVVSQSEYDQRRTQMESARQQYEAARNGAAQQYQSLQAAQARVALAHKTLADTTVRSPFAGLVAERMVSVGDYVTKGMKVAVVVRVNPMRVLLTIPEQFVSAIKVGAPVTFQVDAFPGREFSGSVRYVSPSLEATRRALTVEAVVPNASGELKPGLFATARIDETQKSTAVMIPAEAIQTNAGTSRVYVVNGDHVEERIVTTGQQLDSRVEIATGLKAGEKVATKNVAQLFDGAKVS